MGRGAQARSRRVAPLVLAAAARAAGVAYAAVVLTSALIVRRERPGGGAGRRALRPVLWTGGAATAVFVAANVAAGSGLRGLVDRVGALDGRIALESPPDEGTTLRAEIPL